MLLEAVILKEILLVLRQACKQENIKGCCLPKAQALPLLAASIKKKHPISSQITHTHYC